MTSVLDKYDLTECYACDGTGANSAGKCRTCDGAGQRRRMDVEADHADDDDGRAA